MAKDGSGKGAALIDAIAKQTKKAKVFLVLRNTLETDRLRDK